MEPRIQGLRYVPDYLDATRHDRLMHAVDSHQWLTSVDHNVQIYGFTYNHAKRAVHRIGDLPLWSRELAERLQVDSLLPAVPNQLVVNDYPPGTGIFSHIDQAVFGDVVASVSLGSPCVMQFSLESDNRPDEQRATINEQRLVQLLLEPRSVLILSDEARWTWQHGIAARTVDEWQQQSIPRSRRVSLTFRIVPRSS